MNTLFDCCIGIAFILTAFAVMLLLVAGGQVLFGYPGWSALYFAAGLALVALVILGLPFVVATFFGRGK